MIPHRVHFVVTPETCGSCGGGKFTLGYRPQQHVSRPLVPCASCDDGHGPTGHVLVPGRPPLRQRLVRVRRARR